jgi:hypothetical protein
MELRSLTLCSADSGQVDEANGMTAASVLLAIILASGTPAQEEHAKAAPSTPDAEGCEALSRKLFGAPPASLAGPVKAPKRTRYVKPEYPEVPTGTVGSGIWLGEALIGPDGHVRTVSVLRDLKFTPSFPAFSKAISDAILQWRYAPTTVDGKAVPVCMTISVNIHWR